MHVELLLLIYMRMAGEGVPGAHTEEVNYTAHVLRINDKARPTVGTDTKQS